MVKRLKLIDDDGHKDDAMKSIIFESDMRARFPSQARLKTWPFSLKLYLTFNLEIAYTKPLIF
jgi:hypothetical protein